MEQSFTTQHSFTVISNESIARDLWRMRIASDVAQTIRPGQFMNLSVPGDGSHILRIPLSFKRANADDGTVELIYAVVGEGTRRLSHMRAGESSTLTGPCGKGWRLPSADGRALLVAGGVGLPPVMAVAQLLKDAGVSFDAIVGARTVDMLCQDDIDELAQLAGADGQVVVCTDDGSAGKAGFTTEHMASLVAEHHYGEVYSCGPTVMMAGVARIAHEHALRCQVSLERMMGCGFGACSCCNVALVQGGYALCCQDGPVFDAEEVAW